MSAALLAIIAAESDPRQVYEGPSTTTTLVVPAGVTTMCFAAVAQGLDGASNVGSSYTGPSPGGRGGACAYVNNLAVTPGESLSINVTTSESAVRRGVTVLLRCAGFNFDATAGVVGFTGGGNSTLPTGGGGGGGGAAGFTATAGGGGDGGVQGLAGGPQAVGGGGGGGNGLIRSVVNSGAPGAAGSGGTAGSSTGNRNGGPGGKYGGGGGGAGFQLGLTSLGGAGGIGAVVAIWGPGRSFPSNSD